MVGLETGTYSLDWEGQKLKIMIDEMQEEKPVTVVFTAIIKKDNGTIENKTTLTSDTTKDKQYNVETEVEVKPEAVDPEKPNNGENNGENNGQNQGDSGENNGENDGGSTIPPDMNTNSNSDTSNHPNSDKNGRGEDISEEIVGGNQTSTSNGYRTSPNTGLQVNSKPFAIGGGILCIVAILLFAVIRKRKE